MDRIVGIDLGTTNSLVAYMEASARRSFPATTGSNLLPSVVALDAAGHTVVGNAARARSHRTLRSAPSTA